MGAYSEDILGLDLGFTPTMPAYQVAQLCDDYPLSGARDPLTPWPAKLPLELALGAEPQEAVLLRLNVSEDDFCRWALMPAFRRALAEAAKVVREEGLTFRMLCQGIAQDFLPVLDQKLHDPDVGFSAKLDAFKYVSKLGGLEPKEVKETQSTGNMVNIQINL